MIKRILFLSLILITFTTAKTQNYADSLTQALTEHFQKSDLPGFAVSIVSAKGIHYKKGFGFADKKNETPFTPETVMNIASITKTFVGVALIKAIEEGKLTLDTPINDILPFEITNPYHKETPILIRHLVTHTSSIKDTKYYGQSYVFEDIWPKDKEMSEGFLKNLKSHQKMPLGDFLKKILNQEGDWYKKKNFLKSPIGTESEYSNLGAAMAAYIVEIATETPFKEYSREKVLKPLRMKSSGWNFDEIDMKKHATLYFPSGEVIPGYSLITYADGGLLTCVADLSLYLQEVIKAYSGNSEYLNETSTRLLLPGDEDENRAFWGMGKTSRNIGHGGSDPGVATDMQFNADRKIGRIIFTNTGAGDNDKLRKQYRGIHTIVAKYEDKIGE